MGKPVRCCGRMLLLNKVEEETSGRLYYTDVGCKLLDGGTCRCKDYAKSERPGQRLHQ